jgi:hydrogenase maturation protein HypF
MERRAITVQGVVQGVGFRPFVYSLAQRLRIAGFVKNCTGDVLIEAEGESASLEQFITELVAHPPPLARVAHLDWTPLPAKGDRQFLIESSENNHRGAIFLSPDVATCDACLKELLDPADRRYRYPFLNCTNCGPRLTIITGAPYDRPQTTMAGFTMCPACRAEYDDPANRRFHAQPTCCRTCGPMVRALDREGIVIAAADPIVFFAEAMRSERIGAIKGLGGYHLACAARSNSAVAELRRRKVRDEKPFALMVRDVASARWLCNVSQREEELLRSRRRPIVLLRKRSPCEIAEQVAPNNPTLGVMLPYTPLHHLLLREVDGAPDEPIAYDDADALRRLSGIADLFLVHDRPIHVRCDDSVTRVVVHAEMPIRRSRGYAPEPIALPHPCPMPIAAVGGQMKGTFALGDGAHAFVSHHLGDLDQIEANRAFVKDLALYEQLFGIKPRLLVHDLHPDYASTHYARARGDTEGIELLAVQHHHAHMASCMAEHGLTGQAIGVSFDGTGFGTDAAIWGGEFLVGGYRSFRRAAHLRYVGMPGGEQAIREPWRMALAHLVDAGENDTILVPPVQAADLRTLRQMIEKRFNTPQTSSAGRLFDAVAAMASGRMGVSFEGQAAMELEWLAGDGVGDETYPWEIDVSQAEPLVVDTRPLIRSVVADVRKGKPGAVIARRFHATIAAMIVDVCIRLREATGINTVVLSGGVFMNALLTLDVIRRLRGTAFAAYRQQKVPPNDGGLSLGQLAIGAAVRSSQQV